MLLAFCFLFFVMITEKLVRSVQETNLMYSVWQFRLSTEKLAIFKRITQGKSKHPCQQFLLEATMKLLTTCGSCEILQ